jgi:hypothetical protein
MVGAGHTHRLSAAAALVAVGVALGYLLAGVPNVEGISAVSFFAGYHLGIWGGAVVGGLTIGVFSLLNPLGPPVPQVLLAQIIGMGLIGAAGHVWGISALKTRFAGFFAVVMGLLLTLVYGVLTDYGFAVSIGRWRDPIPVIAAGLPFSVVHVVSNGLIFGGLGAFLVRRSGSMGETTRA